VNSFFPSKLVETFFHKILSLITVELVNNEFYEQMQVEINSVFDEKMPLETEE
jgi:hypothetical protein